MTNPTLADLRRRAACLKPGMGAQPSAAEILDLIIALIDTVDAMEHPTPRLYGGER